VETTPAVPAARRSILQSSSASNSQVSNSLISDNNASREHVIEAHNRANKLFREYSNDGHKKTSFHVANFAGLTPIWPIIKFSVAPLGATKDKRIYLFVRCIMALLGEFLCVDDTAMAMIATLSITNDRSLYITSKTDLPTNFTKLGKYVMISGGSWVFSKKEKGSNDVYARFRVL
jgi:hypothetical protein